MVSDMSNTYEVRLTVAQRIRVTREAMELEQVELAERLKTSRTRVSNWERGASEPDFVWAKRLAHVTGAPWWWLMGYDSLDDATTSTIWYARFPWSGTSSQLRAVA